MATKKTTSKTSAAKKPAKKTASAAPSKKTASAAPSKRTASAESRSSSSPAKKSASGQTARKRSASKSAESSGRTAGGMSPSAIATEAARQLYDLTGREIEGVTGLRRTDDGWSVEVETVELRRIPDTSDMLALYEVDVSNGGDMMGYRRARRYVRGSSRQE